MIRSIFIVEHDALFVYNPTICFQGLSKDCFQGFVQLTSFPLLPSKFPGRVFHMRDRQLELGIEVTSD